jgi:RNA polymerase sigma-70 factor, ECF subfamily
MLPSTVTAFVATAESDATVIERVLSGERQAYAILMRRYNQRLYRVAWALTRDAAEAEDVVQESWVRAFQRLDQVTDPARFRAWLTRVAVNEALHRRRQHQRRESLTDPEAEMMTEDDPESLAAQRELRPVLEAAVSSLPDMLRVVFVLREVEGMAVADIADSLGIQEATVKTRAFRARELLRSRLCNWSDAALPELLSFAGDRCARIAARVFEKLDDDPALPPPEQRQ